MNNSQLKRFIQNNIENIKLSGPFKIPQKYLKSPMTVSKRLGKPSANGSVFEINFLQGNVLSSKNVNKLYVIKYVPFNVNSLTANSVKKSFDREIQVGQTNGIQEIGTKIYGSYKAHTFGIYIMDNLFEGNDDISIYSLFDFRSQNPLKYYTTYQNRIFKKLINILRSFYKLGYYHGDLHAENIIIILRRNTFDIKLIDYGSSQLYASSKNLNKNKFENILMNIHNKFMVTPKAGNMLANNVHQLNGALFRSNGNVLFHQLMPNGYYQFIKSNNK